MVFPSWRRHGSAPTIWPNMIARDRIAWLGPSRDPRGVVVCGRHALTRRPGAATAVAWGQTVIARGVTAIVATHASGNHEQTTVSRRNFDNRIQTLSDILRRSLAAVPVAKQRFLGWMNSKPEPLSQNDSHER